MAEKVVTLTEVKDYLAIDFEDTKTDNVLNRLIDTADAFIVSACGANFDKTNAKAKQVALMIIYDLFDVRTASAKQNSTINRLYSDMLQQINLETSTEVPVKGGE